MKIAVSKMMTSLTLCKKKKSLAHIRLKTENKILFLAKVKVVIINTLNSQSHKCALRTPEDQQLKE